MSKILKIIGKNIFALLVGAVVGIIVAVTLLLPQGLKEATLDKEPGTTIVAAIALAPVLLIIYGMLGVIVGGFGAVIIYNILKLIFKRRNR